MAKAEREPEHDHRNAYGRFESLAKGLVNVPKDEIKRKKRAKAKRKDKASP